MTSAFDCSKRDASVTTCCLNNYIRRLAIIYILGNAQYSSSTSQSLTVGSLNQVTKQPNRSEQL
jgi:hypothetical protein